LTRIQVEWSGNTEYQSAISEVTVPTVPAWLPLLCFVVAVSYVVWRRSGKGSAKN
jgi:hypothetical protein